MNHLSKALEHLRAAALDAGAEHADLQFIIGLVNCARIRMERQRVEAGLTELRRQCEWLEGDQ